MGKPAFSKVPGEKLTVDMQDVHVPRSLLFQQTGTVTVGSTDMQVRLSPRELGRLAVKATGLDGLSMEVVGGKLHAKLASNGINIDVPVVPQVQDGKIALDVGEMSGSIPAAAATALKSELARGVDLPQLPFDAQLTHVDVQDNAVVLSATVKDLAFTR
jgi:LmeA-like phospholipid-binding